MVLCVPVFAGGSRRNIMELLYTFQLPRLHVKPLRKLQCHEIKMGRPQFSDRQVVLYQFVWCMWWAKSCICDGCCQIKVWHKAWDVVKYNVGVWEALAWLVLLFPQREGKLRAGLVQLSQNQGVSFSFFLPLKVCPWSSVTGQAANAAGTDQTAVFPSN